MACASCVTPEQVDARCGARATLDCQRISGTLRNIVECDEEGDEYYPGPHLYCKYAENGEPYESKIFKLTDEAAKLTNLWPGYTLEAAQQQPSVMKKLPKRMGKPEAPGPGLTCLGSSDQ